MDCNDGVWIFESPDGGKTLYRRHIGSNNRELVSQQDQTLFNYGEFVKMIDLAKDNLALKKALENLLLIYYTVRDE